MATIAVLTSGGDAQGMNAAVRAVVRAGIHRGAEVYAVHEGLQGLIDGGDRIRRMEWRDVGGILHKAGTIIGTARSAMFREREGRLIAARNLVQHQIDRLVVIGGDGSLSGADELSREWPGLLAELEESGELAQGSAKAFPALHIAGIVGSIDNDMVGTDMTVGADSALHRVVEAVDALASTAASHHRCFVVEVMGRRCGYLALTAGLAGGCDHVIIPERPPGPGWEDDLAGDLERGRANGRRESIVLVAEGAKDVDGDPVTADRVARVIEERLHSETRVTILGHIQRGGTPTAFDRSMASIMGIAAVEQLLADAPAADGTATSVLIGIRHNKIHAVPLVPAVARNRELGRLLDAQGHDEVMAGRGESYAQLWDLNEAITAPARSTPVGETGRRIGVLHAGGLAPGMNAGVRAIVRIAATKGHTVLGIERGFHGLARGEVRELRPVDVEGWIGRGGCELGTRRHSLRHMDAAERAKGIAAAIDEQRIDALVVIGGFEGYELAAAIGGIAHEHPALRLPVLLVPASIDNNLPATELSIGSDTALNVIVEALDRIKASALAARRSFVVETMGQGSGYLPLVAAIASGAEQVYLPEEGIDLAMLLTDLETMKAKFAAGQRLYLAVRGENADPDLTTDVIASLLQSESGGLYDVRTAVLGHVQQGGDPTPFDRILAARFAEYALEEALRRLDEDIPGAAMVGLRAGALHTVPISELDALMDLTARRPRRQWWTGLVRAARDLADEPLG